MAGNLIQIQKDLSPWNSGTLNVSFILMADFFMKPILIIKAGTTMESLRLAQGDFDEWIVNGSGKSRNEFIISPVYDRVLYHNRIIFPE